MSLITEFKRRLAEMPVVAILRGVKPDEVEAVVEAFAGRALIGARIKRSIFLLPNHLRRIA